MNLHTYINRIKTVRTERELDWLGERLSLFGDEGVEAVCQLLKTGETPEICSRAAAILGTAHVCARPDVVIVLEDVLLVHPLIGIQVNTFPAVLANGLNGYSSSMLVVEAWSGRTEMHQQLYHRWMAALLQSEDPHAS